MEHEGAISNFEFKKSRQAADGMVGIVDFRFENADLEKHRAWGIEHGEGN